MIFFKRRENPEVPVRDRDMPPVRTHRYTSKCKMPGTGIAAANAIQLFGERLVLPDDMSAKQWVAMAELIHATTSASPSYMPALSASRHDFN